MEEERNEPDCQIYTLDNGIRWIHKEVVNTKITHCGVMMDVGSRDELHEENGIAHFWEHMAFKGTKTRKSSYILNRIDSLGGELNAYTTKEKICFHSSLLEKHTEKAIDLLADISFNSSFPPKEIEKERQVILEEISMYADDPEDAIQDDFDGFIFKGNPLGNNILGTKESVQKVDQDMLFSFLQRNVDTSRIVVSTVAPFTVKEGRKLIDKYFGHMPTLKGIQYRNANHTAAQKQETVIKPISQAHCMIGRASYSINHPSRITFFMICNLLGGPAMNARLNLSIREKHGLVYAVDAHYTSYVDTGLFSIYFGTEKSQIKKATSLVLQELKRLREVELTATQLKSAQEQLKGQLAMAEENNNGFMMMMAKSLLDLGYVENLKNVFKQIDNITSEEIIKVSNDMFQEDKLGFLVFEPKS